jgi:hypothetical protein
MERHNTTWYDSWSSCEESVSPNPDRGNGHWIMYNLGYNYNLKSSHWWNYNVPGEVENGARIVAVDLSSDGVNWNTWGEFEMIQANGHNHYEGEAGPNFDGAYAQYVLLTIIDNHGGECVGISEMKIDVDISLDAEDIEANYCFEVAASPNPFQDQFRINFQSNCTSDVTIWVEDAMGRIIQQIINDNSGDNIHVDGSAWKAGIYFIVASSHNSRIRKKVIKI